MKEYALQHLLFCVRSHCFHEESQRASCAFCMHCCVRWNSGMLKGGASWFNQMWHIWQKQLSVAWTDFGTICQVLPEGTVNSHYLSVRLIPVHGALCSGLRACVYVCQPRDMCRCCGNSYIVYKHKQDSYIPLLSEKGQAEKSSSLPSQMVLDSSQVCGLFTILCLQLQTLRRTPDLWNRRSGSHLQFFVSSNYDESKAKCFTQESDIIEHYHINNPSAIENKMKAKSSLQYRLCTPSKYIYYYGWVTAKIFKNSLLM